MNKQLAILMTGLLAAHTVGLAPAQAQAQDEEQTPAGVKFYCGKSYDPVGRKNVPATLASIPNREKPSVVIMWISEYFPKYAPQKRCDLVSPKFQAAYTAGRLKYLVTGTDKRTGSQIVCGAGNQDESCDGGSNMLFTLKPYGDSASALNQLTGGIGGNGGPGTNQGSGNREIVSLKNLFKVRK